MKKKHIFFICISAFVVILLLVFLLFIKPFTKSRNSSFDKKATQSQTLHFTDDLSFNGTVFAKTSFVHIKGGTVKGSDRFTTNTVPVTRAPDTDGTVPHVRLPSVFGKNTVTTISPFFMGRYEVTQELYKAVIGAQKGSTQTQSGRAPNAEPSYFVMDITEGETQALRPVERVTWFDAVYFCNALSTLCGYDEAYTMSDIVFDEKTNAITDATVIVDMSKNGFRLPTEAEWEYAARSGFCDETSSLFTYAGSNTAQSVGWICTEGNYNIPGEGGALMRTGLTHEVGLKKPNDLGIFDMTGNVQEWCFDIYDSIDKPKKRVSRKNPIGNETFNPEYPSARVARGGSWYRAEGECTVTFRMPLDCGTQNTGCGIRPVRTPYKDESW